MHMLIHCGSCGGSWEIYQRDNWKNPNARQCPHCFREIDAQTWALAILPAFGAFTDANNELIKDNTDRKPFFHVDRRCPNKD